ncbi:MAG: class I SAM-dependent methyltransferase [Egibacteraceae bacterium]
MSDTPSHVLTQQQINDQWNRGAGVYDSWLVDDRSGQLGRSPAEINAWRLLWQRVLGPPPLRVLDVGTGTGMVGLLLALLGYEVTAVDAAESMLDQARRKAGAAGLTVTFQHALADRLPYPDGAFDAVVCRLLLQTLLEPERCVREWRRCVRPGGRIAAVNNRYHGASAPARLHRRVGSIRRRTARGGFHRAPERAAQLPLWRAHPTPSATYSTAPAYNRSWSRT